MQHASRRNPALVALLASTFFLGASPIPAGSPFGNPPGGGWAIVREDLVVDLDISHSAMSVHGNATVTPRAPSDEVTLWLNSGVYTKRAIMSFVSLTTTESAGISLNQTNAAHPGSFFTTIHFNRAIRAGETVDLSFEIKSLRGNGFTFTIARPVAVVEGANGWYPQTLSEDGKLDAERDQPPGTTTFLLPHTYRSVSNGSLIRTAISGDRRSESWNLSPGAPRSFAAGPYKYTGYRVGKITVGLFTLRGTNAATGIRDLGEALSVLQAEYGPFPYPRYDVAEVADNEVNWAGLAARELTVEQSFVFKKSDAIVFFSHEAAHAWWGNLVGKTGPGIFMVNEAMAQYSAFTVLERIRGHAAYVAALDGAAEAYFSEAYGRPIDKPLSKLDRPFQSDYNLALDKGTWVYYMLRERVGSAAYFSTFRVLARKYAGREMTLQDIRAAFLANVKRPEGLKEFFSQWLDRKGAPVVTWVPLKDSAFGLKQWQPGDAYALTFPVRVRCGTSDFSQVVHIDRKWTVVPTTRRCTPVFVDIDPRRSTLMWRSHYSPTPAS